MDIDRLLKIHKNQSDKKLIELIISNRINFYLGNKDGAAVSVKNFGLLADDILKWHESKRRATGAPNKTADGASD